MDPSLSVVLGVAKLAITPTIRRYLARFPDPNTADFKEARDEMFRDWLVEEKNAVAEVFADLIPRVERVEEKVNARGEDVEAHGVYANYASQAYREPIAERRRMLAHAAAAIVDVRLSIAEHARVQRRIDEIDPEDVLTLYGLSRTYGRILNGTSYKDEPTMRYELWKSRPHADALRAAGCVDVTVGPSPAIWSDTEVAIHRLGITAFGLTMLRVLRSYCRAREVPFVIPGREVLDGEAGRDAAVALLGRLSEPAGAFVAAVTRLVLRDGVSARYSAPNWSTDTTEASGKRVAPPPAKGTAHLDIGGLSREEALELHAFAPYDARTQEVMHGLPRADVRVEAVNREAAGWAVRIYGPHDVLRHLVDDLDVRWW